MKNREEIKELLKERYNVLNTFMVVVLMIILLTLLLLGISALATANLLLGIASVFYLILIYFGREKLFTKLFMLVCKTNRLLKNDTDVLSTTYSDNTTFYVMSGQWKLRKYCEDVIELTGGNDLEYAKVVYKVRCNTSLLTNSYYEDFTLTKQQYEYLQGMEDNFLALTNMVSEMVGDRRNMGVELV